MAGSSMKDIKLRIKSVENTRQITRAMQLVATSKIRKAKDRMEQSKPYLHLSLEALQAAIAGCEGGNIPFVTPRELKKRCYVVIAGDRGLAGGYNANVFRALAAQAEDNVPWCVLPIGKKAIEKYQHMGAEVLSDQFFPVAGTSVPDCYRMASLLIDRYNDGSFDELWIVNTSFRSMMAQDVQVQKILPLTAVKPDAGRLVSAVFEPDAETMLRSIMPDLLAGCLYSALCDACASENAARRNAMDSATKNADGMISALSLKYNRARQGSITQEITEIVAGAEK